MARQKRNGFRRNKHICNKTVAAKLLSCFVMLHAFGLCSITSAQIPIQNGSFEGMPGGFGLTPGGWQNCLSSCSATMPYSSWIGVALNAVEGLTYYSMDYSPNNTFNCIDSVSQDLKCPLIPGKAHFLTIYIYTVFEGTVIGAQGHTGLKIYGGNHECKTQQLLWESPTITSQWKKYFVEFTPDSAWNYIILKPWSANGTMCAVGIDAMSGIYVDGYTFLQIESEVNPSDSNCYSLTATSDMGNVTCAWSSEPALIFTGSPVQDVCITEDTRVTVKLQSPCGEYKDTVFLKYHTTNEALVFPNAFTPNNDGKNDDFKAINSEFEVKDYSLHIYNRWGQLLFETEQVTEGWDGTMKSMRQPDGTYFFTCTYENEQGELKLEKGNVTLIR